MMALSHLEDTLQNYLFHSDQAILQHIVSTNKVPAQMRLAIYYDAYRTRLHEALMTSYPVLQAYLGDEAFQVMVYEFMDAYPSEYRSIRWFGDKLPDFLNHTPALAELAKFEWAMGLVFDAANTPVLTLEEMGKVAPEQWVDMRLHLHSSVQRLSCSWNVVEIWQSYIEEQTLIPIVQNMKATEWVLWRQDDINRFSSLSLDEAWAIDAIHKKATFGEVCDGLCEWVDEDNAALHAASLLKGWLVAGLITSVEIL